MKKKLKEKEQLRKALALSGIGFQMGITIFLSFKLGEWLDAYFNKTFLAISFTLLAVCLSTYLLLKQVNRLND